MPVPRPMSRLRGRGRADTGPRASRSALTASLVAAVLLTVAAPASAQSIFRSTQSANLPTTTLLREGLWMFEISHRFDNAISNGSSALWGLDGPVWNRLGLSYAPHERLMLGVLRSNRHDNVELNARFRGFRLDSEDVPLEVVAQGGISWNTELPDLGDELQDNEMQAYAQLVVNALVLDRVALGLVPTVARNPRLADVDSETAFALGLNGEVHLGDTFSLIGEWVVSEERADQEFDSGAFGVEIRTRGHFFKLVVTNQPAMNPAHVLGGTRLDFGDPDIWRLGFNVQRVLSF